MIVPVRPLPAAQRIKIPPSFNFEYAPEATAGYLLVLGVWVTGQSFITTLPWSELVKKHP